MWHSRIVGKGFSWFAGFLLAAWAAGAADAQFVSDWSAPRLLTVKATTSNYSDIWWNPGESGWGLTIADHESQLFAVWYTYRSDGQPTWYVIPGGTLSSDRRLFSGDLFQTSGPPYDATFDSASVTTTKVGTVSIDFAPPALAQGSALFQYTLNGVTQSKQIERQPFGDAAPSWGNDFTDLWWNPDQSGWGFTLAQHGNNIFGVLFAYGEDRQPLFVVMPGVTFVSPTSFTGSLYTTTGPSATTVPFDTSRVHVTKVGEGAISFDAAPGTKAFMPSGRVTGRINGHPFVRQVTPQPFGHDSPASPAPPQTSLLVVNVTGSGTGRITSTPDGIACPAACQKDFARGTVVMLSAVPDASSQFGGFAGACSGAACTISLNGAAAVTATFQDTSAELKIGEWMHGDGEVGSAYSDVVAVASGGTPPYNFTLDTSNQCHCGDPSGPPAGVAVATGGDGTTGVLSGTPTAGSLYVFGVCVRDSAGHSACTPVTWIVNETLDCLYTYTDWSACGPDGTQTRTVLVVAPPGCTKPQPQLQRQCQYTPAGPGAYAGSWSGTWTYSESMSGSNCGGTTSCNGTWQANVDTAGNVSGSTVGGCSTVGGFSGTPERLSWTSSIGADATAPLHQHIDSGTSIVGTDLEMPECAYSIKFSLDPRHATASGVCAEVFGSCHKTGTWNFTGQ